MPVAKYWDDSIPGMCINRSNLHYALAGFNIVNDIALLAAPVPYLKGLQIPRRAKIVLMAVFACGGLCVFPVFCVSPAPHNSLTSLQRLHCCHYKTALSVRQQLGSH